MVPIHKIAPWLLPVVLLSRHPVSKHAQPAKDRFITVPAGEYTIGEKGHPVNPLQVVQLDSFSIAATELTNAQFARFIEATHYVTVAERYHNALTFEPGLAEFDWKEDSTACWRFPFGTGQPGITHKMDHPVTCISFIDAQAYCRWAGVRLPTLAEWEVASRAGSHQHYFWGNNPDRNKAYANIWRRNDHLQPDSSDGYTYTSPVGSFAPNAWGLYDVYGNVFELCANRPAVLAAYEQLACARGGSWWCSAHACNFFNSVDIGRVNKAASFSNIGFRVVKK